MIKDEVGMWWEYLNYIATESIGDDGGENYFLLKLLSYIPAEWISIDERIIIDMCQDLEDEYVQDLVKYMVNEKGNRDFTRDDVIVRKAGYDCYSMLEVLFVVHRQLLKNGLTKIKFLPAWLKEYDFSIENVEDFDIFSRDFCMVQLPELAKQCKIYEKSHGFDNESPDFE